MGKAEKSEKANNSKINNKKQKHFWKDFKAELKKVIWPTRSQVVNNTIIVIVIVIIITAIVFVLDFAFEALNKYGIDKLKTTVRNSIVSDENNSNTDTEENKEEGNIKVEDGTAENSNEENSNAENNEENNNTQNNETPDDVANVENVSE